MKNRTVPYQNARSQLLNVQRGGRGKIRLKDGVLSDSQGTYRRHENLEKDDQKATGIETPNSLSHPTSPGVNSAPGKKISMKGKFKVREPHMTGTPLQSSSVATICCRISLDVGYLSDSSGPDGSLGFFSGKKEYSDSYRWTGNGLRGCQMYVDLRRSIKPTVFMLATQLVRILIWHDC